MNKQGSKTTCQLCGLVFYTMEVSTLCLSCGAQIEEYEQKIREYMRKFPKVTAAELSAETDVPMQAIDYLIADDFFFVTENHDMIYKPVKKCKKCNKPVQKGRYCDKCLLSIVSEETKNMKAGEVSQLKKSEAENDRQFIKFHMGVKRKRFY